MGGSAIAGPTVSFPDTPEALLDYLVQRSSATIGHRVDRADIVILGTAGDTEVLQSVVADEDLQRLDPSIILRDPPQVIVDTIEVAVERILAGDIDHDIVTLVAPRTAAGSGGSPTSALPEPEAHGVVFARHVARDSPFSAYLPEDGYETMPEEPGMVGTEEQRWDDRGRPVTADRTAEVTRLVDAVTWYAALPTGTERTRALIDALGTDNPSIVRHALRELAQVDSADAITALEQAAEESDERLRAHLALWLADHTATADDIVDAMAPDGVDQVLGNWGLSRSTTEGGAGVLYGPDPSTTRSD